jgi:P-type Cu2+ transporter
MMQEAQQLSLDEQRLRSLARDVEGDLLESEFYVPGMHCMGCMNKIERGLAELPFVDSARTNLSTKRVRVKWMGANGQASALQSRLADLGFEATVFQLSDLGEPDNDKERNRLLLALGVAGFAAANIMLLSVSVWSGADGTTRQLFHLISGIIAIPAIAYAGRPFFSSAYSVLRHGRLNMDVPISLAVITATAMSIYESLMNGADAYFDAALMLLFFLLIGRTLDYIMRERARGAVTALARMAAKGGVVIGTDGRHQFVPLRDIQKNDRLLVPAGERVPVDSVVLKGASKVDRSLVTGESAPASVAPGDVLEAGVVNLSGSIEARATKTEDNSFLAEVVRLMEAAEKGKARFVRIADRIVRFYAPAVHVLALATFIGWMIAGNGEWHAAAYSAIAVLIITCPCALGLAVPIVHVIGAGRLFSRGVMLKGGTALEKLCNIDTVIFDKTGTLTLGRPTVTGGTASPEQCKNALDLARTSAHPAAKAVARYAGDHHAGKSDGLEVQELPGLGLEASINDRLVRLGRQSWVNEIASGNTPASNDASQQNSGTATTVWICREGEAPAFFELDDALRPDARKTVEQLRNEGLEIEILSGDADLPVQAAARALAIATVGSELKPQDKIDRITALQRAGRRVMMIGDGLNDAPALAAADVSMTPSSGSDVGRQSADLVFVHDSLEAVTFARHVAKRADRLVKQNIAIAIIYNCIAVPFAVAGYVTPLVAAIAMSSSSILVVANSMRLYRNEKPDESSSQTSRHVLQRTKQPAIAKPTDLELVQ